MTFQHPEVLWLLAGIVPLWSVGAWLSRRRHRRLESFVARETWPVLNNAVSARARGWKGFLVLSAFVFLVIAGARPLWGTREQPSSERGIDLIVALDVSFSMLAQDVAPSRLEESRRIVRQLLARFPGHRVGLIPFAGDAFLQCPLTTDYGIAMNYLMLTGPDVIGTPGTDIGSAIERAREAFRAGGTGARVLILITDGEDHGGRAMAEAQAAARDGIRIETIGIGSPTGAPVMMRDELLQDRAGEVVLSRVDADLLRQIAGTTGGQAYLLEPERRFDLAPLVASLERLERHEFGEGGAVRRVQEERFQIPLAIALLLLLAEALLGERRRRAQQALQPREAQS